MALAMPMQAAGRFGLTRLKNTEEDEPRQLVTGQKIFYCRARDTRAVKGVDWVMWAQEKQGPWVLAPLPYQPEVLASYRYTYDELYHIFAQRRASERRMAKKMHRLAHLARTPPQVPAAAEPPPAAAEAAAAAPAAAPAAATAGRTEKAPAVAPADGGEGADDGGDEGEGGVHATRRIPNKRSRIVPESSDEEEESDGGRSSKRQRSVPPDSSDEEDEGSGMAAVAAEEKAAERNSRRRRGRAAARELQWDAGMALVARTQLKLFPGLPCTWYFNHALFLAILGRMIQIKGAGLEVLGWRATFFRYALHHLGSHCTFNGNQANNHWRCGPDWSPSLEGAVITNPAFYLKTQGGSWPHSDMGKYARFERYFGDVTLVGPETMALRHHHLERRWEEKKEAIRVLNKIEKDNPGLTLASMCPAMGDVAQWPWRQQEYQNSLNTTYRHFTSNGRLYS